MTCVCFGPERLGAICWLACCVCSDRPVMGECGQNVTRGEPAPACADARRRQRGQRASSPSHELIGCLLLPAADRSCWRARTSRPDRATDPNGGNSGAHLGSWPTAQRARNARQRQGDIQVRVWPIKLAGQPAAFTARMVRIHLTSRAQVSFSVSFSVSCQFSRQ